MVLLPAEISPDTLWLDDLRLLLIGQVQGPSLLNPMPDKIATGDYSRANDLLLSSWVISDLRGGLGVEQLREQEHADRYRFGTLWVLQDQAIYLPHGVVEVSTGVPASTEAHAFATYQGVLYGAFNTKIRYFDGASALLTPSEPSYVDLAANATDALVLRQNSANWLVFADANGYLKFDGTTWTYVAGDGTTIPRAQWLEEWDGKLHTVDVNGGLWSTTDLTAWTKLAAIPLAPGEVRGLDVFFDPNNNAVLHAPSRAGLWLYSALPTDKWYLTRLRWQAPGTTTGDGHCQWRDEYYMSDGLDLMHYQTTVVNPVSLGRDDGLPSDLDGDVACLEPMTTNWLAIGVNGTSSQGAAAPFGQGSVGPFQSARGQAVVGNSAIYLWTGSAFHAHWIADSPQTTLRTLHYSNANGARRLWWNAGSRVFYSEWPSSLFNPRTVPTWPFAPTGYLETGRYDANFSEDVKLAVRTRARARNITATEHYDLFYRLDQGAAWSYLGRLAQDGLTTWTHEQTVGAGDGLPYYDWQYRVEGMRGDVSTASPVLVMLKQEWALRKDVRNGYRFRVLLNQTVGGRTVEEQAALLEAMKAKKTLVAFNYRPLDRTPLSRRVLVTAAQRVGTAGLETADQVDIAVVEV